MNRTDIGNLSFNLDDIEKKHLITQVSKASEFFDNYTLTSKPAFPSQPAETTATTITKIKEIPGGKVIIVTFNDGKTEKVVRDDYDEYNLTTALLFALSKHLYRQTLTWEGIEFYATYTLPFQKNVMKMINKAIKNYEKEVAENKKREEQEAERKRAEKNRKEKKIKYNQRRREKKKQEQIDILAAAMATKNAQ